MLHANETLNKQSFFKEYFCNMICATAVMPNLLPDVLG